MTSATSQDMAQLLTRALASGPPAKSNSQVVDLRRLSGGANMETWAFDWLHGSTNTPLILRRLPTTASGGATEESFVGTIGLPTEAQLLDVAHRHGVDVPTVVLVLEDAHQLGTGYIMTREPGEALPFRILADDSFSNAREKLAWQCGAMLGRIHQIPPAELPESLPDLSPKEDFDRLQALLDDHGNSSAVHQLALNWLRQNKPSCPARCLVHGDYRNGNFLVDERGLVAVLDWELAHIGNPAQDLGYICSNVWRFGQYQKPVGGFGEYRELLDGYRSVTGNAPSLQEIHYWEVYTALGWGIVCLTMIEMFRSGQDQSLERAAVGRRMSESEIDLLLLLDQELDS